MHRGGACLDERLHHLVGVQRPAEARLCVGDDRREPVGRVVSLGVRDLVGAEESVVDPLHECGRAVCGIEALVRVGVAGEVRVGGDLPAGEVDRLQTGLHHLDCLAAGHRPECRNPFLLCKERPQSLGAETSERVLDRDGAAETLDVLLAVGALDRVGRAHGLLSSGSKMTILGSIIADISAVLRRRRQISDPKQDQSCTLVP